MAWSWPSFLLLLSFHSDFRGFDSSIFLVLRGGIPRSTGNFPEVLTLNDS